jgi:membrane protein DedA with SNARE-associated domain
MTFLDALLDFLLNFYGPGLYLLIFSVLLACGLGIPIPEDITLFCGGVLAYYGLTDVWMTIFISFLGVMIGDSIVFFLGARFGRNLTQKGIFRKLLNEQRLDIIQERFLLKHGNKMIFAARFMPGLRAPLFFSAGTLKVPFRVFIFYDGVAALISVPAIVYLVFHYGSELERVVRKIQSVEQAIVVGIAIAVVVAVAKWFKARQLKQKGLG